MVLKLSQALEARSEQELQELARWWGIKKPSRDGWHGQLAKLVEAMQDTVAARFAWEHLSEDERKVLHNAINFSTTNGAVHEVLLKITRLPETQFENAVATLKAHSLLLEHEVSSKTALSSAKATKKAGGSSSQKVTMLLVPKEILEILSTVGRELFSADFDRTEMKLEKILLLLNQQKLYEIGNRYGFVLYDYYSRNYPSARLAAQLMQPDTIFFAWEQFGNTTRKLCKWLCDAGGQASMADVSAALGYDAPALASCIHELEDYAMAFDTFSGQERKLVIPRELLKNLKKATEQTGVELKEVPVGLVTLETPPPTIQNADTLVLYDLAVIIGAVYQQIIEPTQAGKVPKRIANKLDPLMQGLPRADYYGDENFYIDMLFETAQRLGLLQFSKSSSSEVKRRYEPGPRLREWSQQGRRGQSQAFAEAWRKAQVWVDIAGTDFEAVDAYYIDSATARKVVLDELAKCAPGSWYKLRSFLNTIKGQNPFALRPRQASAGMQGFRSRKKTLADWDKCDGQIITGILSSSLYEMGFVSLGYTLAQPTADNPANPDAFMLTNLASSALNTSAEQAPEVEVSAEARTLIVQPNFELLLLQPDLPTLYALLPFAQVNQVGMVSRLTLTRNTVLRGMESGQSIEGILQALEQHSQKELPQNVVYTLRDWSKLYKDATVSQVLLVEVPGEAIANEICSSPKFQALNLRRVGPCALAVGDEVTLQTLRRVFDKEGIVLHIHGEIASRRDGRTPSYGKF